MNKAVGIVLALITLALGAGCVGGPHDKCFVDPVHYREARRAFERTQSLEVVEQGLRDAHWPRCQINETIYRLEKEFGLYDTLPSPKRFRTETELAAEEFQDAQATGGRAADIRSIMP